MIKPMISVRAALDHILSLAKGPLDDETVRHKILEIEDFEIVAYTSNEVISEKQSTDGHKPD